MIVIYRHMTIMSRLISCHDFSNDFLLEPMAMTHVSSIIEALLWGGLTVFDKVQLAFRPCFQGKLLRHLRYLLKPT